MRVNVGSKNPVKVDAVAEILLEYPIFRGAEIISVEAKSEVAAQPKSLEETIEGARNRARNAFTNCNYSIGIESGLFEVPMTKSGYMDVTACAIYDGKTFHLGLGPSFEYPKQVVRLVHEADLEINDAVFRAGLTEQKKLGSAGGMIGLLTKGRLVRKEYTKQAIRMALIHIENPELYPS